MKLINHKILPLIDIYPPKIIIRSVIPYLERNAAIKGGTVDVTPFKDIPREERILPRVLQDLIPKVRDSELVNASFEVGNERKLTDFDMLLANLPIEERRKRFPVASFHLSGGAGSPHK